MRVSSNSKMTDEQAVVFGEELKRLRKEAGLSGAEFAELIGCKLGHVYSMESAKRKPSPELAERIADVFALSVDDMLVSHDEKVWQTRKKIGKQIREYRENKGIPMAVVAGALGIPLSVYKEYEQGLCSIKEREIDLLDKLLDMSKKPEVVEVEKEVVVKVPAEIPAEISDLILTHIKDLQVDEATQKTVWRYFNNVKLDAEERKLFG